MRTIEERREAFQQYSKIVENAAEGGEEKDKREPYVNRLVLMVGNRISPETIPSTTELPNDETWETQSLGVSAITAMAEAQLGGILDALLEMEVAVIGDWTNEETPVKDMLDHARVASFDWLNEQFGPDFGVQLDAITEPIKLGDR